MGMQIPCHRHHRQKLPLKEAPTINQEKKSRKPNKLSTAEAVT